MKILISGGTGFIGSALLHWLLRDHECVVRTRNPAALSDTAKGIRSLDELSSIDHFDIAINLAGEAIADKRWSKTQADEILNSRITVTEEFISYFKRCDQKPELFISGSAIGYYGQGIVNDEVVEDSPGDDSFSSQLCSKWEACANQAKALGIRTCILRTGIVLGDGGALAKMLPPFKLGLGGRIGSGRQWMPWIHIDDMVAIIVYCISNKTMTGAINCTAPYPVTNTVFVKSLGKQLRRPTRLKMPSFVVKILMGKMGEELLLNGKNIVPKYLIDSGYVFKYPHLDVALENILE